MIFNGYLYNLRSVVRHHFVGEFLGTNSNFLRSLYFYADFGTECKKGVMCNYTILCSSESSLLKIETTLDLYKWDKLWFGAF